MTRKVSKPNWIQFQNADKHYAEILKVFGFNPEKDQQARNRLFNLRKGHDPRKLINQIKLECKKRQPLFFGAGPNLMLHLTVLASDIRKNRNYFFLVAADGSARALNLFNLTPNVIFTDLDGLRNYEFEYFVKKDIICFVHGHGDNIALIEKAADLIHTSPNIVCTTQSTAKYPIINPGGFTDGDRGVFLMNYLCRATLEFWLFGYCFQHAVGTFSKPNYNVSQPLTSTKKRKLKMAKSLLLDLTSTTSRKIYFYGTNFLQDLQLQRAVKFIQRETKDS